VEVDPRAVCLELILVDRAPHVELGSHHGQREQPVDLERHPAHHAVRIRRHDRVARTCADVAQQLVAAEHPRAARTVGLRRGEDDPVPRACDGVYYEREVLAHLDRSVNWMS
jgi:hypothetical protein